MFIGIQIRDGKDFKALIANTREELENNLFIKFDRIDESEFAEICNGVIYTDRVELETAKKTFIRARRDALLATEVDPVVSNSLRWADMSEEDKQLYTDYRTYLLDYTKADDWWLSEPKTFDEWKQSQ